MWFKPTMQLIAAAFLINFLHAILVVLSYKINKLYYQVTAGALEIIIKGGLNLLAFSYAECIYTHY